MNYQYGNHIGVIINSLDPEGRGRVQVLIPHLSTTLLEQWNVKATDIKLDAQTFQEYLNPDHPVGKSLRENLPWAEAARPLLGSGGTTIVGQNGKTEPAATPILAHQIDNLKVASNALGARSGAPVEKIEPFVLNDLQIYEFPGSYVPYVKPNEVRSLALEIATNNWLNIQEALAGRPRDSTSGSSTFTSPQDYVDNFIIPVIAFESSFNPLDSMTETQGEAKGQVSMGLFSLSDGNIPKNSTVMSNYGVDDSMNKRLKDPTVGLKAGMALMENTFRRTSKNISVADMTGRTTNQVGLYGEETIRLLKDFWKNGNKFTERFSEKDLAYYNGNNSKTTSSRTREAAEVHTGGYRSGPREEVSFGKGANYKLPQGSNSVPQPGNMVWVFFLNGDLQKPVYFASVTEAYANARDQAVPVSPPAEVHKQLVPKPNLQRPTRNNEDELNLPTNPDGSNTELIPSRSKAI